MSRRAARLDRKHVDHAAKFTGTPPLSLPRPGLTVQVASDGLVFFKVHVLQVVAGRQYLQEELLPVLRRGLCHVRQVEPLRGPDDLVVGLLILASHKVTV